MRRFLLFFVYGLLVLSVKSAWQMTGDLLLLAVIFLGFAEEKALRGLAVSCLLGYLLDVASVIPLGTGIFSYALTYGLIRRLRSKILFRGLTGRFFWIFVLTLVNGVFLYGWMALFDSEARPFFYYLQNLLWNAFVTPLLGWFILPFLKRVTEWSWERLFPRRDPLLRK